jgi:nucleoside phosphorylase
MNLYELSTVCADHKVPLYCWRVVSDWANDSASPDFKNFVANYTGEGGQAIAELVRQLPANPKSPFSYPRINRQLEP